jgi:acyl transferase
MSSLKAAESGFSRLRLPVGGDAEIELWRQSPLKVSGIGDMMPVVVAGGFGKRMNHGAGLALYLAGNGFDVYRYDTLDHVGLSSGCMLDFTMTRGLLSMRTVVDWVSRETGSKVHVVAGSLSARMAYRLLAESDVVANLITIVGVVNLGATLARVLGHDYAAESHESLPEVMTVEGHEVRARPFWVDVHENKWLGKEPCRDELLRSHQPVTAILAKDDLWVDQGEVRDVLTAQSRRQLGIVSLGGAVHDLGRNMVAARNLYITVCSAAMGFEGRTATEPEEPSFQMVVAQSLYETRMQRAGIAGN